MVIAVSRGDISLLLLVTSALDLQHVKTSLIFSLYTINFNIPNAIKGNVTETIIIVDSTSRPKLSNNEIAKTEIIICKVIASKTFRLLLLHGFTISCMNATLY